MYPFIAQISRFASDIKTLLNNAANTMKNIRDEGSYRAQDVFRTFIVATGGAAGVGASGDMSVIDLGSTTNVYVHLKLPITNTQDKVQFRLSMEGYCYGASKIVNVAWAGMMNGGSLVKTTAGTHPADVYVDANGNLVCSILFNSIYYTTFNVESICHDNSKRIIRGQLQGKVSLTSTVVF